MISLLHLNKLNFFLIFIAFFCLNSALAEEEAIDIWGNQEGKNEQSNQTNNQKKYQ